MKRIEQERRNLETLRERCLDAGISCEHEIDIALALLDVAGAGQYLSAEVKDDWEKERMSIDTLIAAGAFDKKLKEVCPDETD